jgi:hypothetical protein
MSTTNKELIVDIDKSLEATEAEIGEALAGLGPDIQNNFFDMSVGKMKLFEELAPQGFGDMVEDPVAALMQLVVSCGLTIRRVAANLKVTDPMTNKVSSFSRLALEAMFRGERPMLMEVYVAINEMANAFDKDGQRSRVSLVKDIKRNNAPPKKKRRIAHR